MKWGWYEVGGVCVRQTEAQPFSQTQNIISYFVGLAMVKPSGTRN